MTGGICKGICKRYEAKGSVKPLNEFGGIYAQGFKRCSSCYRYLKWSGKNCMCCGMILKVRPNKAKYKYIDERLYIE